METDSTLWNFVKLVGLGWTKLVIRVWTACNEYDVKLLNVSSKWGRLCVTTDNPSHRELAKKIAEVQGESAKICEMCGKPGKPSKFRSGIATRCIACAFDESDEINRDEPIRRRKENERDA